MRMEKSRPEQESNPGRHALTIDSPSDWIYFDSKLEAEVISVSWSKLRTIKVILLVLSYSQLDDEI